MKKMLAVLAAAGIGLTVAGCNITTGTNGQLDPSQLNDIAKQVEQYTAQACAFQPTASAVLDLVGAFYQQGQPAILIAEQIGQAICHSQVAPAPAPVVSPTGKVTAVKACPTHVVVAPNGQTIYVPDRRCLPALRH